MEKCDIMHSSYIKPSSLTSSQRGANLDLWPLPRLWFVPMSDAVTGQARLGQSGPHDPTAAEWDGDALATRNTAASHPLDLHLLGR